jgi:hypothetical protein
VRTALRIIAAVSMAALVASAQAPDPATLGPKVGERVPDFRLPDQHGATRWLNEILGPKGAVLVFFRSADW